MGDCHNCKGKMMGTRIAKNIQIIRRNGLNLFRYEVYSSAEGT